MPYLLRFSLHWIAFLTTSLAAFTLSCTKPAFVPPDLKGVIKSYQRVIVHAAHPPWTGSNIFVNPGDRILILASGRVITWKSPQGPNRKLAMKIGRYGTKIQWHGQRGSRMALGPTGRFRFFRSTDKGELKFCVIDWSYLDSKGRPVWHSESIGKTSGSYSELGKYWYQDNTGSFKVDVFVFATTDDDRVALALDAVAKTNPSDPELVSQLNSILDPLRPLKPADLSQRVDETPALKSKPQTSETHKPVTELVPPKRGEFLSKKGIFPKSASQSGHIRMVTAVAFHPNAGYILSGGKDNTLRLWETASGREIRVFKGHRSSITAVAFSSDGTRALSGSRDYTLRMWDVASGKEMRVFNGHAHHVTSVAFSPDGRYALSGSDDHTLRLWEVSTGREVRIFKGHRNSVTSVVFSPDGRRALSGSWDNSLLLWDVSSGENLKEFKGHSNLVTSVAFSPDGQWALSGSQDQTMRLWNVSTGDVIKVFKGHTNTVTSVKFSPDGHFVLSGSEDKTLCIWVVSSGKKIKVLKGHRYAVTSVAFNPDGRYALSGGGDNTIRLWDVSTRRQVRVFWGHTSAVTSVAINPKGDLALSGNGDGSFRLWDLSTGRSIRVFKGHTDAVTAVAFSPDGKYALSGSHDQTLRIWEIATGRQVIVFRGHTGKVTSAAFSQNGRFVISGSANYELHLWEIATGRPTKDFYGHRHRIQGLALSPDGQYAFTGGSDSLLAAWNIEKGQKHRIFKGLFERHTNEVTSVALSPAGKFALSGSWDHTLRLWRVSTGRSVRVFKGHTDVVTSVAFSPDGRHALSGSRDNTIRSWKIMSGIETRVFKGHTNAVTSIGISPDGKKVLSGSDDGSIRVWNFVTGQEIASFYHFSNGEWMATVPDGYYNSSPEGGPLIYWVLPDGLETFSFEQFESRFKRPDIIKARLAGQLSAGTPAPVMTHPPRIELAEHMAFKKTTSKAYPLKLTASAPEMVTTVRIFVNGKAALEVPVNSKQKDLSLDVPLFSGANRITAIAYDEKGFSSNPKYLDVDSEHADLAKPNLYVFAIGVSRYPGLPNSWQLEFAHTDAKALTDTLLQQEGKLFGEVRYNLLINENASAENIMDVFDAMSAVGENDLAIIFMAGHGVKDRDGTFYFLTTTGNIEDPRKGGLSWGRLGKYIDRIKARVILFLDACHSGSIVTETVVPNDQLAQQFFAGGRGGVMVFSASKGRQYSMESPDIGGGYGIFTYALVQGLGPNVIQVDSNQNRVVEFMELVDFVSNYVDQETEGEQTPWLSRKELFGDLPLALVE
ncbi:MAG: caspase family protein [Desulfobacterales bacterium]|jgi:WD40 repeat protein